MSQPKRVALLLGVAEYKAADFNNLPACANDVAAMQSLLEKQFDIVRQLDGTQEAPALREQLSEFFRSIESQPVSDLLVFLTGHGGMFNDDFHFLLSDYDEARHGVTSISNTEIDTLARGVSPDVYCKIVDACHSGVSYVKDASTLQHWVEKGKTGFRSCYFYFSSQSNQQSYASSQGLSDFTSAIIRSIAAYAAPTITYSVLATSVGDMFRDKTTQTPHFVSQGKATEIFLKLDDELRRNLGGKSDESDTASLPVKLANLPTEQTLADRIKQESARFVTKEQALSFLECLQQAFQSAKAETDLEDIFTFSATLFPMFSGDQRAAAWLEEHKSDAYFAKVSHVFQYFDTFGREITKSEADKRSRPSLLDFGLGLSTVRTTATPFGFSRTEYGPWDTLVLSAQSSLFLELPRWYLQMTYVLGPRNTAIFYDITRHERTGWEKYESIYSTEFDVVLVDAGESTESNAERIITTILRNFQRNIRRDLARRYPK